MKCISKSVFFATVIIFGQINIVLFVVHCYFCWCICFWLLIKGSNDVDWIVLIFFFVIRVQFTSTSNSCNTHSTYFCLPKKKKNKKSIHQIASKRTTTKKLKSFQRLWIIELRHELNKREEWMNNLITHKGSNQMELTPFQFNRRVDN